MARNWYAVQHGNDYSSDWGSTNKREAFRMARELGREFPREEIRISVCMTDPDDDFCLDEIIVREAK